MEAFAAEGTKELLSTFRIGALNAGDSLRVIATAEEVLEVKVGLSSRELKGPNGLFWEGESLLIGVNDRILSWKPGSDDVTVLIETSGGIDGLQPVGSGGYLISDWTGVVRIVSQAGEKILIDTTRQRINLADFCYIADANLLVIPTFGHNQLWSFELVR